MTISIEHLPPNKQAELKSVVEIIRSEIKEAELEMIILFGSYARGDWVEDAEIGPNGTYYKYRSDFDILAIVVHRKTAEKEGPWHRIQEQLRQAPIHTPVTIIRHEMGFINKRLGEGNYFFADIQKEGILLYDSGRRKLGKARERTPEERKQKAADDFDHWYKSAKEFVIDFRAALNRGSFAKAAFELHQAVERFYSTLLLVFTGYKPKTHDLKELGQEVVLLEPMFLSVFPTGTEKEKRLFELLCKAYIDARYDKNYTIVHDELEWLGERVEKLEQLTEEICKKKIESFTAKFEGE